MRMSVCFPPLDWRNANVSPVFKKGEKYKAENYRPISLTCICCKLLEHIITSHIARHLAASVELIWTICIFGGES
jgi:hypothetical protein